ncbi:unnamed protein product [Heligmosomoides polygyrus]|uniref:HORMA domain-containing protein n=1 Tax=Heligmosomoides polygyrus TaxID=6339 RepID=A0A183F3J9_HELPZ|nr:unnamed protein product [Heligmosomoides polygyrus]
MKDEGYMAVICAVLYDDDGNGKDEDRGNRAQLLEHIQEIYPMTVDKHEQLLQRCLELLLYQLEVVAHFPSTQTMVLYIYNEKNCRQYAANTEETYTFNVGHNADYKLKFAVARFSGEKRKAMVRSGSFLKRIMTLDRREDEHVVLSTLPVNACVKKSVFYKGHQYGVDLKMLKTIDHANMPQLDFDDLLDLARTLHEHDAENTAGGYSGDLSDKSFALLQSVAHFSGMPSEVLKILILPGKVFNLAWNIAGDPSLNCLEKSISGQFLIEDGALQIEPAPTMTSSKIDIFENGQIFSSKII